MISGQHLWRASDLASKLGYKSKDAFQDLIGQALDTVTDLELPWQDHFIAIEEGRTTDHQLSRFACWLIVMYADRKKTEVVDAQARFSGKVSPFGLVVSDLQELERLPLRKAFSNSSKNLSSIAARHGLNDFSAFTDAGYQGFYAMHKPQLLHRRGLQDKAHLQDFMGKTELEASLFRLTLTAEKITVFSITGQNRLEQAHHSVGQEVRDLIKKNTGAYPERLPVFPQLDQVKARLRSACKKMQQGDVTKQ